ncbi:hypothetical protein KUCAC02_023832 [Chaenocephalus aceratus]|uniref:Uncharacterized protein n=1 Tax=Chaenocephalus aceratus TaxID=36190 RepID=A0ACB9WHK8_CHAAC|nr:hypothetical protein KUCAC02_023832 [Chaenocephalus aceratus]
MPAYFQRPEKCSETSERFDANVTFTKHHGPNNSFLEVGQEAASFGCFVRCHQEQENIEHGRRSTSPSCSNTWSSAWIFARATWPRRVLYQYKNICQQVNIKSLEDVVRAYLKLAEEKTETAKGRSQQMVLDIEDLDNIPDS